MAALTVEFRKHSGPTSTDDMAAQIITDCGNFTLDFKQHGFCTLTCSHTIPNYDMILWYAQVIGDVALNLIGYVRFTVHSQKIHTQMSSLLQGLLKNPLLKFKLNASGRSVMYYCAASEAATYLPD